MDIELHGMALADVERAHILETLRRCAGNRTHTARVLDISIRSLRMRLNIYAMREQADLNLMPSDIGRPRLSA